MTKFNTNENVRCVMRAIIDGPMHDTILAIALGMVENGSKIPEEIADLFTIEIVTRPSGSKYAVVDFA